MEAKGSKIEQRGQTHKDIYIPPGIKVSNWIFEIVENEESTYRQSNTDYIPKPAQIGPPEQEARLLGEAKAQIDQSAAR